MNSEKSNVEKLQEIRPDLVEHFKNLKPEEFLEAICGESLDALGMEDTVSLFMELCTDMSKTNYTPDVIKSLVQDKRERDIDEFCYDTFEEQTDEEALQEFKQRANNYIE